MSIAQKPFVAIFGNMLQGRSQKKLMTEAMFMEDLWPRQSVHGWVLFLGIKSVIMTINNNLMLRVNLPVVDTIHPKRNKFAPVVKIMTTLNQNVNDSLVC